MLKKNLKKGTLSNPKKYKETLSRMLVVQKTKPILSLSAVILLSQF